MKTFREMLLVALIALAIGVGLHECAQAQAPTVTVPSAASNASVGPTDASGTIATTSTWQQVFAAGGAGLSGQGTRKDCLIQNVGANTMFLWYGSGNPPGGLGAGAAITTSSFQIIPPATNVQGGSLGCATGAVNLIQDAIWITGTAGDGFIAKSIP